MRTPSGIRIRNDEIELSFTRSSGPGGQNVNKVATTVLLRFDAAHAPGLPPAVRRRLIRAAGRKADRSGVITIRARKHRTQNANRRLALHLLEEMVEDARVEPADRVATSPSRGAKRRRLESKRRRSHVKRLRRGPGPADD
ncbi:MAG: alternative ribosome rescue aminoacyl-tRNA hydrolase ArfB [Anaerolineales bacterium]